MSIYRIYLFSLLQNLLGQLEFTFSTVASTGLLYTLQCTVMGPCHNLLKSDLTDYSLGVVWPNVIQAQSRPNTKTFIFYLRCLYFKSIFKSYYIQNFTTQYISHIEHVFKILWFYCHCQLQSTLTLNIF